MFPVLFLKCDGRTTDSMAPLFDVAAVASLFRTALIGRELALTQGPSDHCGLEDAHGVGLSTSID
jgi:hypothetical protein